MEYHCKDIEWKTVKSRRNNIESNLHKKQNSFKRILCKNISNCNYGNNCKFAHSLEEQIIIPNRKIAYDIIKHKKDLSDIDLHNNNILYNNLLCLSQVCRDCIKNICSGGYNCKHGNCDSNLVICDSDLKTGVCEMNCNKIHLTDRGMRPYINNICLGNIPKSIILNNTEDISSESELSDQYDNIIDLHTLNIKSNDVNISTVSIFNINMDIL